MKDLNLYIIEKLKIDKNTTIDDKKEFLLVFYLDVKTNPVYNTFGTIEKVIEEIKKRNSFLGVFDITESTYGFSRILENIKKFYATQSEDKKQKLLDEVEIINIKDEIIQILKNKN